MTNTTHSPLILNEDIRAYLLTTEAKISYEGGVTFLKEEVNSELASTLNDFMGEYGAEIAGVVETGKQALRNLGNAASTAAQKATALDTLNQLAKDIDQYAKAYQEIPSKITNPKLAENFKKSIGHVLGSLAETISDQKMAVQLLNQMSDIENAFKGAGKAIAGIGTFLSVLDLGSAVVNEDGDAFGKSLTINPL